MKIEVIEFLSRESRIVEVTRVPCVGERISCDSSIILEIRQVTHVDQMRERHEIVARVIASLDQ